MIQGPSLATARSARVNAKERDKKERRGRRVKERKGNEAQREKPSTPTRAIDALSGDEEQNEQQKKKKKETERGPSYPGLFGRLTPAGVTR